MTLATNGAGNVASLHQKRGEKKRVTRADSLMEHCRGMLREHMDAVLPGIMEQVDDALFDLADRAQSNQLQSTYFEAMRSVRLCRGEILSRFTSELDSAIERKMYPATRAATPARIPDLDPRTFTLVEQDDLEETVAAKNIAGKIRNLCHEELFALDRRLGLVLSAATLEGEDNPLGPEVLCNAARSAVDVIEASVEVRLLVLKLFDRHLTRTAEQVYPEINAWLVKQGVLPNARANLAPRPDSRSTSRRLEHRSASGRGCEPPMREGGNGGARHGGDPWAGSGGSGSGAGWEAYHSGAEPGSGNGGGEGADAPGSGGSRGAQILGILEQVMRVDATVDAGAGTGDTEPGRDRLIGSLTRLQHDPQVLAAGTTNVVRGLQASAAAGGVSHVDGLMIDVVAMMFDFILEDPNIGDGMRALIGRLQIPVLKVAILDKSFFARRSHPARSFINTLAEFGVRCGDEAAGREAAFRRVQDLVTKILDEFEVDLDVFSGALDELVSIVAQVDDVAKQGAWGSARVAEERERLTRARRQAEREVETRLEATPADPVVAEFLRTHWRQLLGERLFREGARAESWSAGLQTMDHLLWSVGDKREAAQRERLLAMLPFLLERVKAGMRELCLPEETRSAFLSALADLHIATLRGADPRDARGPHPIATAPHGSHAGSGAAALHDTDSAACVATLLRAAVECANELVWETAAERLQCQGMGTTVVAIKLHGRHLVCAHVGDSRLYRMRAGVLAQLSRDHTYRQEVIDKGLASEEEAAELASNLITRAVGGDASVNVDVNVHEVLGGDLFLICSDGLNDMVEDAPIARLMQAGGDDLSALASSLVAAANAAGGRDNVSVGLLRVDAERPSARAAGAPGSGAPIQVATATDPGRLRSHNEDAVDADAYCGALVLADGMGGHNAGEVASAMTVKVVMEALRDAGSWVTRGMPPSPEEQERSSSEAEFDFQTIDAVFWDDQVSAPENAALHAAVAAEVQELALASDADLVECFDIEGGADDLPTPDLAQDATRDPLLDRLLRLASGTWVEFGDTAGKGTRARLSWIAPDRARYLFTNRVGQKVCESTPHGLAVELRLGRMRVLDGVPLFDRAVSRLTRRLRAAPRTQTVH
jgi:serine/threonine protein phosphatase PrpC